MTSSIGATLISKTNTAKCDSLYRPQPVLIPGLLRALESPVMPCSRPQVIRSDHRLHWEFNTCKLLGKFGTTLWYTEDTRHCPELLHSSNVPSCLLLIDRPVTCCFYFVVVVSVVFFYFVVVAVVFFYFVVVAVVFFYFVVVAVVFSYFVVVFCCLFVVHRNWLPSSSWRPRPVYGVGNSCSSQRGLF